MSANINQVNFDTTKQEEANQQALTEMLPNLATYASQRVAMDEAIRPCHRGV